MGQYRSDLSNILKESDGTPFRRAKDAPHLPRHPLSFVLYFLRFYAWGLALMLLLEGIQATCHILVPSAIQQIIDSASSIAANSGQSSQEEIFSVLKEPLLYFVLVNVGVLLSSRASGAVLVLLGPALRRRVRYNLYGYLQHHSQRYFMGSFAGSLSNRIAEVSMSVNHSLWTVLFDFWPILITFSVSMYLLAGVHSGLALFLGGWVFLYVVASFFLATKCRRYAKAFAEARSTVSGKIVDAVTNVMNSKMFAHLDYERKYLGRYLDQEVRQGRKTFWFMERMYWFQFTATLFLKVILIAYALHIWTQGGMTIGQFAMVTGLALLIIGDARNLSRRFLEFFEYVGNITDGVEVIVKPHEVIDREKPAVLKVKRGKIEFEKVNFSYSDGIEVFRDLNLVIEAGERVGLVGFSGSGKTTFVNLIQRFFDLKEGRILVDDQDIARVSQSSLREQVSMIPQDPMLFHRSLLENIRYGKLDASDEEVIEAAKKARAHDFIVKQEQGYSALVGERGIRLSGGQRQRIAIARAILKDAPILMMDEATSSLDSVTEKAIQASLEALMKEKTVIVIAHRLSTISHLDRIVVFHGGKIVETGTHDQLLRFGQYYSRLWGMQAGGFLPDREVPVA